VAHVDGAERPDAEGADDRAPGAADGDAVATVESDELTLDDDLINAALNHSARRRGYESWPAYVREEHATGNARRSFIVFEGICDAVRGVVPLVEEQLGILVTENDDLQGELNDVRQVLAELGVPTNPALSLRRQVKHAIKNLRVELQAIRTRLREAGVDGTQYEDVSTLDCVQMLVDARDGALRNWERCHRRHLDMEEKPVIEGGDET
jgi:hypothetical protein